LPGHSSPTSEPSPGDSQDLEVKRNHYESDTKIKWDFRYFMCVLVCLDVESVRG